MSQSTEVLGGWAQRAASNAGWLVALGVLTVITGFLSVVSPLAAGLGVTVLLGIALAIAGAARTVAVFNAGSFGQGALPLLGGFLSFVAGVIIATRPGLGLEALTLMLGGYLLVDGVAGAVLAFHVRPQNGWGWILFGAALSAILGIMLLKDWPLSGQWAIGTIVGINLLSSGASMIAIGSAGRGLARRVTG
jgi:uncharacterized membrane protein HdeD (DUF308 family)